MGMTLGSVCKEREGSRGVGLVPAKKLTPGSKQPKGRGRQDSTASGVPTDLEADHVAVGTAGDAEGGASRPEILLDPRCYVSYARSLVNVCQDSVW